MVIINALIITTIHHCSLAKEKEKWEKLQKEEGREGGEEKESVVEEEAKDKAKNTINWDYAAMRKNPGVKASRWDYNIEIRENENMN